MTLQMESPAGAVTVIGGQRYDYFCGCGYLGYNYENGVGATTNLYSARDYYNLGCTKGYSTACGERDRLNTAMGVTTP